MTFWEGVTMKTKNAAIIGVTVVAVLAWAPFETPATGAGGGLYAIPPYGFYNNGDYTQPGPVIFVSQPPIALTCQHSKEIKTVPSESGGTREITITRC